jgi:hypothetical protein
MNEVVGEERLRRSKREEEGREESSPFPSQPRQTILLCSSPHQPPPHHTPWGSSRGTD